MELRQFRYFVAVAEELHFGRAAERLHMAQPPLSRQIRALERELGVALFHRTKRKVELTGPGAVFLAEARGAVEQANHAVSAAQLASRAAHLEVTYTSTAPYAPLFSAVIRKYRKALPAVQLALCEMTTTRQLDALADGQADVSFVRPPLRSPPKSIVVAPLLREPLVVALHEDHPLAKAEVIVPEALADEPLILAPRGIGLYDQIVRLCRRAGFEPNVVQEAQQIQAIIALVSAGLGLTLVPASVRSLVAAGVVYRPLAIESDHAELALAHRRDDASAAAQAFITLALEAANDLRPR